MNKSAIRYAIASVTLTAISGGILCIAENVHQLVGSESGVATFYSTTNVPGIEVKGSSNALTARADVLKNGNELILQKLEATVPVKSLATGMKIRDEHMRKYIFATPAGQEPDLRFSAEAASCPAAAAAQGFACQISGNLNIRGVARPFAIALKVREQSGSAFRVAGDGIVKLSDYGIAPPTQFGVKPIDQVAIHLDFTGKEMPSPKGGRAGEQQ